MDQFVSVRIVQANGLDLNRFQFDYDLTFSVFLMNADMTLYGRYGSRSERHDAVKDMSIEGFGKTLAAALELHKNYPSNRKTLAGKQSRVPRFSVPEDYPLLKGKYTAKLDYEGKVVQSCIHCHQVRDAERMSFRTAHEPMPDEVLYPWPMPQILGLQLDAGEVATVTHVASGTPAERGGFRAGDEITAIEGQPIISTADIQWVLQNAPPIGVLKAEVMRGTEKLILPLTLGENWRRHSDISWRVTSWDLRRMATGGLLLRDSTLEERTAAQVSGDNLNLFVEHVGQYGEHAVAKKAGFQESDIIVSVEGQTTPMTESQLFGYLLRNHKPADKVPMVVVRNGKRINLSLPMQ